MKTIKHITNLAALVMALAVTGPGCSALLNFDDLTEGGTDSGIANEAGTDATLLEAGTDMAPVEAGADMAPVEAGADMAPVEAGADMAPVEAGVDMAPVEAGMDQSIPDIPIPDIPIPDMPIPDMPVPDVLSPDFPVPDMPVPDMPVPDMPVPDMPVPDMPVPDMFIPDQAVVDQGSPDSTPAAADQSMVEASTADAYVQLKCGSAGPFYPQAGCCNPSSETVMTCTGASKDTPQFEDCSLNPTKNKCGWNATAGNYGCVTSTDPTVDPSGQNPRNCNP